MKKNENRSKEFFKNLRKKIDEVGPAEMSRLTESKVKENTLTNFARGRAHSMSEETLAILEQYNLLPEVATIEGNKPLESFSGETKSIEVVAEEKGYGKGTIKKYCLNGKLDYVLVGDMILIACNEKFSSLKMKEKAILKQEIARLKLEAEKLKKENEILVAEKNKRIEKEDFEASKKITFDACNKPVEIKKEIVATPATKKETQKEVSFFYSSGDSESEKALARILQGDFTNV